MNRRRLGLVAACIAGLIALACSTGDSSPDLPSDPLGVHPSITDMSEYRYDARSIANISSGSVVFVDPLTGDASDSVPLPQGPPGAADAGIVTWFIVDTADDTYVVFVLAVSYPQDGLTPRSTEYWILTVSRRTGDTIYERMFELPAGTNFVPYYLDEVAVDPAGTAVFNVDMDLGYGVVAVPFLPGRAAWSRDADGSNHGWHAHMAADGVVLLTKGTDDQGLYGIDSATGTTLWHVPVDGNALHPDCVVRHGDHFVVLSDWAGDWPLAVTIRNGAVSAARSVDAGCAVDPAGNTIVDTDAPVTAYNLPDGRELWSLPRGQVYDLGLKVVGIFAGRLYVETDTQRLVLDARTGEEVGTDWVVFPLALHEGWILARHVSYSGPVVYPGTELPAPSTTPATEPQP